jgi:hypothetical protein
MAKWQGGSADRLRNIVQTSSVRQIAAGRGDNRLALPTARGDSWVFARGAAIPLREDDFKTDTGNCRVAPGGDDDSVLGYGYPQEP